VGEEIHRPFLSTEEKKKGRETPFGRKKQSADAGEGRNPLRGGGRMGEWFFSEEKNNQKWGGGGKIPTKWKGKKQNTLLVGEIGERNTLRHLLVGKRKRR